MASSVDAIDTNTRLLYNVGAATIRASGCDSTWVFQTKVPRCASSAYTVPLSSPKIATLGALITSRCAKVRFSFFGSTTLLT